ncbi:hypothetical protein LPB86_00365 [Pedobacter sp. MC2016-14]|uniref:DUF4998 domain-containing protein n=1 Tax=Pedobacter sp. MC2016-14 TaxID=2897327 RepID=UPI001E2AD00F|nr:DUF4998 domain-containing protein [Pedobacter sp. MC2016-14]MCD0486663.1 hypothetical protein [Pedobacter sp. MC2016-14]
MKTRLYIIMAIAGGCAFMACKRMDSTYKQYVVNSGVIYPGKATAPVLHSGDNRVRITWLRGSDPKVVRAKVYWNNYTDSIEFAVPADKDTVGITIPNVPENFYSFIIKTFDSKGNVSVPVELSGSVYGERYRSNLLPRPLLTNTVNLANTLGLQFNDLPSGTTIVGSEVEYTTTTNLLKVVRVKASDLALQLADYKKGTSYRIRTLHLPDPVALDTFRTNYQVVNELSPVKSQLSVIAYSSYNTTDTPVGFSAPANLLDGNQNTRWLSLTTLSYPHFVTIDLGTQRTIKTISLWRWTIAPTATVPVPVPDERGPDVVKFQGSVDNVNWIDLGGNFNFNRLTSAEQKFTIPGLPEVRYIKLTAVSGPQKFVILGEINFGLL